MDLDVIFKLIDRAEKSSFNKIDIQTDDLKLSLSRESGGHFSAPHEIPAARTPYMEEQPEEWDVIRAPISGVFYMAKEPGSAPFVTTGSRVSKGDTVCIIEAMKTMNEISAPRSGVIEQVFAEDGQTVAANDLLYRLCGDE